MKVTITLNLDEHERRMLARFFDREGLGTAAEARRAVKLLLSDALGEMATEEIIEDMNKRGIDPLRKRDSA
jgi:hypothetical protein